MNARFKLNPEWMRTIVTVAFFCAVHFLDNRYVTKADYAADQTRREESLKPIRDAIVGMDKSIALLESNRSVQADHETRIRALEQRNKLSHEIEKNPVGSVPSLYGSVY